MPGNPERAVSNDSMGEVLIEVARQALAKGAKSVTLGDATYPVIRLKSKKLRTVEFTHDGRAITGVEQNPNTKSRWAQLAREGKNVMQFIQDGRYIAVVADGKVITYGR
jgi:hypothetical protein